MPKTKIGVFDSGSGGISVANAVQMAFLDSEVIFKDDVGHLPYGSRPPKEIHSFVRPIFQQFIDEGCQVVIVACNTVTTELINDLRKEFDIPMIGMEPAVKPAAAATKTGVIAVCATPGTLASRRYKWLKEQYAKNVKVLEPDCSDWALLIENNSLERDKVAKIINDICDQEADQIVLGCTHYHWIEEEIRQITAGRAEVIQTEQPVIRQLKRVLAQLA